MNQNSFRKLIAGQANGLLPTLLRFLLSVAGLFYGLVIKLRNSFYSNGKFKSHSADAPVISIGNITTGGTGKTPLVIWLCNFLASKNISTAVLTRGYKTKDSELSDEPAIIAKNSPDAKVVINPDRCAGAKRATEKFDAKALVMDDGFQHRKLKRDLDIVVIDATCPFGYGKILPAGLLREPISSLTRAHAVIVTRCNEASAEDVRQIEEKVLTVNPDLIIAKTQHCPVAVEALNGNSLELDELKGKRVFAFCGIGNPNSFFNAVKSLKANKVGGNVYNDHHQYKPEDMTDIYEEASYLNAELILTTQKDWTKVATLSPSQFDIPLAFLRIELKFTHGDDKIRQLIETALAGKI